jgi:hypothetical protein
MSGTQPANMLRIEIGEKIIDPLIEDQLTSDNLTTLANKKKELLQRRDDNSIDKNWLANNSYKNSVKKNNTEVKILTRILSGIIQLTDGALANKGKVVEDTRRNVLTNLFLTLIDTDSPDFSVEDAAHKNVLSYAVLIKITYNDSKILDKILEKIKTEIGIQNSYIFNRLNTMINVLGRDYSTHEEYKSVFHQLLTALLNNLQKIPIGTKLECILNIVNKGWFDATKFGTDGEFLKFVLGLQPNTNLVSHDKGIFLKAKDDIGKALIEKGVSTNLVKSVDYQGILPNVHSLLKQKEKAEAAKKAQEELVRKEKEEVAKKQQEEQSRQQKIAENNAKIKIITDALTKTEKYSLAADEKLRRINAIAATENTQVEEKDIAEMQSWVNEVDGYKLVTDPELADVQKAFDTLNKDTSILTPEDLARVTESFEAVKKASANVSKINVEMESKLEDIKKLKIIQEAHVKAMKYEEEAEEFKDAANGANNNITDNLQLYKATTYYDAANSAATKAEASANKAEAEAKKANEALAAVKNPSFKNSLEAVNFAPTSYNKAKEFAEEARGFANSAHDKLEKIKKDANEKALAAEKAKQEAAVAAEKAKQEAVEKEKRIAEEQRIAEQQRLAEEKRIAEEKRLAEQQRIKNEEAEKQRLAEQKLANEKAAKERLAEQQRLAEKIIADEEAEKQRVAEQKQADEKAAKEKAEANKKKIEDAINKNHITKQRGNKVYSIKYQENRGQFQDGKKRKIITMNGIEYFILKELIAETDAPIAKDTVIVTIDGKPRHFRYTKGNEDPLNIPNGTEKSFKMVEFEPEPQEKTVDPEQKTIGAGKTKKRKTRQNRKKSKSKRKSRKKK